MIGKEGHTLQLIIKLCFCAPVCCCDSHVSPHHQLCLLRQISAAEDRVLFLLLCTDFVVSDLKALWSGPTAASQRQWNMNVMRTALVESIRSYGCKADDRIRSEPPHTPYTLCIS